MCKLSVIDGGLIIRPPAVAAKGEDMNYFDLINKCLVELNYKQVHAFSELTKNEHLKIKNIINILNTEICNSENWNFLLRKANLNIPKNTSEIENSINGKIDSVYIDGRKYRYIDDYEKFITNSRPADTFAVFNDKFLFPKFEKDQTAEIYYYTSNFVKAVDGTEKTLFETETDSSVIPDAFAEPVLVYGSCLRLKGNPQHIRFSYWMSMYRDALANLRSKACVSADYTPEIRMHRN